ncbi:putative ribonuclease H-like superfamily [Plasmopara halstedii]
MPVISYAPHRFLSLTKVVKRFLELWDPTYKYYDERSKPSNRMSSLKEELRQLYSLIAPVGVLMPETQGCSKLSGALALLGLVGLQQKTLCQPQLLCKSKMEADGKGSKKRFFVRYDPELFLETSTEKDKAKWPHSTLYERRTSEQQRTKLADAVKKTVWDKIRAMAIRAATKLSSAGGAGFEAGNTQKDDLWGGKGTSSSVGIQNAGVTSSAASNVRAPRKCLVSTPNLFKGLFDKRASVAGNTSVGGSLETLLDEEIESFLKFNCGLVMPRDFEPQDVLVGFWMKQQGRFPHFAAVARCIFGNPASDPGIEHDFGIAGVLLNPRRTNLDTLGRSPAESSSLNEADDENNAKADRIFTAEDIENGFDFFIAGSMDDD